MKQVQISIVKTKIIYVSYSEQLNQTFSLNIRYLNFDSYFLYIKVKQFKSQLVPH